jgi:hypothetical protein
VIADASISPLCIFVASLDPIEAKLFPRIPIAPGIITISPGRSKSSSFIPPKEIPAKISVKAHIIKTRKLCLKISEELFTLFKAVANLVFDIFVKHWTISFERIDHTHGIWRLFSHRCILPL